MFKSKDKKDLSKLEKLYWSYKNIMYNEAYNILHDTQEAEDAVQQAFTRITGFVDKIVDEEPAMTCKFLKIVVRNVAKDIYKKRLYLNNQEDIFEIFETDDTPNVSNKEVTDIVIDKESSNKIANEINNLPEIYRDIILLERIYGYSREQTMALLNVNYETLKKRMTRAKNKLLGALGKEVQDDGKKDVRKNNR